jgi:hypothetical protein
MAQKTTLTEARFFFGVGEPVLWSAQEKSLWSTAA